MLQIYTAQMRYDGPDKLDITVKSGSKLFAPTWDMVRGIKNDTLPEWDYERRYIDLMRTSFSRNTFDWYSLWLQKRVVLCCYCPPGVFCHRHILAEILTNPHKYLLNPMALSYKDDSDFFGDLRVENCGEIEIPKKARKEALVVQPGLF